jgi:PDDEXK-like domain of unknown function (DUF3799)
MIKGGIYPDLPNEVYHADSAISRSGIKMFCESPYLYWANYLNPERPRKEFNGNTQALIIGNAFHQFILEPELFKKNYMTEPERVYLNRDGREAYDAYKNHMAQLEKTKKIILSIEDMKTLLGMYKSLSEHTQACELIRESIYEHSYFWEDEHSGLMVKARPDILRHNAIIDLKTCRDANSYSFQRQMYEEGYHIQGAMIREGVKQLTGVDIPTVINICVEKTYPYQIGIKIISESALNAGHMKYKQALLDMKACFDSGIWPSYGIEEVELPKWA